MSITDLVTRAGRSLRNAKVRTLLTSLAIGVGAFTLTLTIAATNGANQYAKKLISSNFDPSVLLVTRESALFSRSATGFDKPQEYDPNSTSIGFGQGGSRQYKTLSDKDVAKIKQTTGVESVTPTYSVSPQYITRDGQKKFAASVEAYNPGQRPETSAGTLPPKDKQITSGTILLPQSYVSVLGFKNDAAAVGQTVTLHMQRPARIDQTKIDEVLRTQGVGGLSQLQQYDSEDETFTIAAITKKASTSLSTTAIFYLNPVDAMKLADFATQGTASYHQYLTAQIRVKDGDQASKRNAVKASLQKAGYYVETVEDLQQILLQVIAILQGVVMGFGVIAIIASVFGIINTQYISVLERTREIGLMKALGMRRRDIGWLFRIEAAWIGFLGGVLGSALAFVVGSALNPWLNHLLDLGKGNYLLIFTLTPIVGLVMILMLIAILAGWLPARKAAKLDPIEALRTE